MVSPASWDCLWLAQHPGIAFGLDSLAAGKAGVGSGLEVGGDGECSHYSTVAVFISFLSSSLASPSFLSSEESGSQWRCCRRVRYLLAVLWWWLIRERPSRLDLGRKQRGHLYLHHCSQSHPFCFPWLAGFGDQQHTHPECLEKM